MSIEISLLKILSIKKNLETYIYLLNPKILSQQSILLIKDYQSYFQKYEKDKIDLEHFKIYFFIDKHPNLDDKQIDEYKEIFRLIQSCSYEEKTCLDIISAFEQQEFYNVLHADLDKNVDIKTIFSKVEQFHEKINKLEINNSDINDEMNLEEALVYTDRSNGLKWRLKCLQEHFNGGLIKGDFGIIAGYVDCGKSSFLCSEISYMAQQLKDDQWIAWLNTEGNWQQILPRIYCATLNCTQQDLRKHTKDAIIKYTEKMQGNKNRIKVLNFQRKNTKDVENLIKNHAPSLIVFDLLDSLIGFENYMGKEGNSTERYGQLYQWAREIATNYSPVLAISQLNGDGNNEPYPSIINLRGSRVDKQAAATFQLIIGGMEGNSVERFLSMPKNKINNNKGWRAMVTFDSLRARFRD